MSAAPSLFELMRREHETTCEADVPAGRWLPRAAVYAAAVLVAVFVAASANAASGQDPSPIPSMALARSDLAPGATVGGQGYYKCRKRGFTRCYERWFRSGASFRKTRFFRLAAQVKMAADPEIASRSLRSLAAKLTARKGRGAYVKARVEDGVSEVTFGRMLATWMLSAEACAVTQSIPQMTCDQVPLPCALSTFTA